MKTQAYLTHNGKFLKLLSNNVSLFEPSVNNINAYGVKHELDIPIHYQKKLTNIERQEKELGSKSHNSKQLNIKNMVTLCCKRMVAMELNKMGLLYTSLELGEVQLLKPITKTERTLLKTRLHEYGLELIEDNKAILVEKIVSIIKNRIYNSEELSDVCFSKFLTNKLNQGYHTLSTLFSTTMGITVEHFIIMHKIEKVKELIMNDELNLTEISYKMNYSSVAHLSNQFKNVTGFTPTYFKNLKIKNRTSL